MGLDGEGTDKQTGHKLEQEGGGSGRSQRREREYEPNLVNGFLKELLIRYPHAV